MTRHVNFTVSDQVYAGLEKMARGAGMAVSPYAKCLFEAAYAARCGVQQGDTDLDAAVARAVVMTGAGVTPEAIAKEVGLQPATVTRIQAAWRAEIVERAAA